MAERAKCEICDRMFKDAHGLAMHNASKHSTNKAIEEESFVSDGLKKNIKVVVIIGVILLGLYWLFSSVSGSTSLPPTDMAGHIESNPSSHVLKEQMDIRVQKHMLEHVDGIDGGKGGVIINYDCKNFECGSDLVEKLEVYAEEYDFVYVAPFKNMPVKIALTKLNRIETLDEFDDLQIRAFIG